MITQPQKERTVREYMQLLIEKKKVFIQEYQQKYLWKMILMIDEAATIDDQYEIIEEYREDIQANLDGYQAETQ